MDEQKFKIILNVLKQLVEDIEKGKYELKEVNIKCNVLPQPPDCDWATFELSNEIEWRIKLKPKR